jgi:hypothetical protein
MADIILTIDGGKGGSIKPNEAVERINAGQRAECWIYGKKGTFNVIHYGEDTIASIGYVCYIDGDSVQGTLSKILASFDESQIGDLKKKLVGQYILLIKKGNKIYLFSDFMGARNIFYSGEEGIISSSFSQVEDLVQTSQIDLDIYKLLEFLAVKHVLYPAWLGRSTYHRKIKWLLPYEYLSIDFVNSRFRIGSVTYKINNKKQTDRFLLSEELLSTMRMILCRREFKDSLVAASLTGGRDSRLVAGIAAELYPKIHYRIAVSSERYDSLKDLEVAKKVAQVRGVPLDVYHFKPGQDEERFRELTEGFSPVFNSSITPLIDNVELYSLGFGGIFGTELFMPIPWKSIDEFVRTKIEIIKKVLKVKGGFWSNFRDSLYDEFQRTKEHFQLSNGDERDYIRLFGLVITARYSSFIMSAFNQSGYQLEPYGSYALLDLALRVSPKLWGNHRRFGGDARIQQAAMTKLNLNMARILTYKNYRPMMPLSTLTFPYYLVGFIFQAGDWLRRRFDKSLKETNKTDLSSGYYLSNGWEKHFFDRTAKKYGLLGLYNYIAN